MNHRTLKRVWHAAGLSGAVLLCAAWVDSRSHVANWDSGWGASGGWELKLISRSSALHLLATDNSPNVLTFIPIFRRLSGPWTSREEFISQPGEEGPFPLPFWVKDDSPGLHPSKEKRDPDAPVAVSDQFVISLDGRIPPTPIAFGDKVIYLIAPYWLLLTMECGVWLTPPIIARRISSRRRVSPSQAEASS